MKQPQGLSGPIKLDHVIRVGPAGGIIARGFLTEPAGVTATSVDGLVLTSEHSFVAAPFHSHRPQSRNLPSGLGGLAMQKS